MIPTLVTIVYVTVLNMCLLKYLGTTMPSYTVEIKHMLLFTALSFLPYVFGFLAGRDYE